MCLIASIIVLKLSRMDSILNSRTIEGLRKARGQLESIAAEAGVSPSWLSKFGRGVWPDPSVRRVERVYRVLIKRGLVDPVIEFPADPGLKECA